MAEEKQVVEETTLTAIEQKASEQGWVPQDQWDGEPESWRPAREFLDRGELFKKIEDQGRTIKELKRSQSDLTKHYEKRIEVEYRRALNELKSQKKAALVEGDADAVIDIDDQISDLKEAQRAATLPTPPEPVTHPIFESWLQRNGWYETNEAMRSYADRVGNKFGASGMSPTEVLAEVEKAVKKEFAHKFENPRRSQATAVESSVNKGSGKKDSFQLTAEERQVMHRFVKTVPGMTEEKYIADLKAIKGVS